MSLVNGIHIRDLPISSAGLPCLPSGAALPPNVLFKLHHDELLNMDAILNEHSNKETREKEFTYYCKCCDFGSFCENQLNKHNDTSKHKLISSLVK